MYETTRHQYLQAMGIDSYMPRCLLSNAAVSQECDWPVAEGIPTAADAPAPGSPIAVESHQPVIGGTNPELADNSATAEVSIAKPVDDGIRAGSAVGAAELLAAFEPEKAQRKHLVKTSKQPKLEGVDESSSPALRFSLSVWCFDDLLVLDSRHSEKALPTEKLLLSLLQANGLKLGNVPKAQVLQWPMFDMPQADNSVAAAREMLTAFLDTLLETPVSSWWLMGADTFHLLPVDVLPQVDAGFGHLIAADQLQEISARPVKQLLTMPSLAEMLERPQLKAKAWRAMRQTLTAARS